MATCTLRLKVINFNCIIELNKMVFYFLDGNYFKIYLQGLSLPTYVRNVLCLFRITHIRQDCSGVIDREIENENGSIILLISCKSLVFI